jgi:hypothetical protein
MARKGSDDQREDQGDSAGDSQKQSCIAHCVATRPISENQVGASTKQRDNNSRGEWLPLAVPYSKSQLLAAHRNLPLQSDRFLIVGIDTHGAGRELRGFAAIAAFQKNLAQQDMRIDQPWIPKDRGL